MQFRFINPEVQSSTTRNLASFVSAAWATPEFSPVIALLTPQDLQKITATSFLPGGVTGQLLAVKQQILQRTGLKPSAATNKMEKFRLPLNHQSYCYQLPIYMMGEGGEEACSSKGIKWYLANEIGGSLSSDHLFFPSVCKHAFRVCFLIEG